MTPTTTLPPEAVAYLDQLRAALADLPAEERDDLLADVEPSLAEAEGNPQERLGPPERFAAELRTAAGLPPRATEAGTAEAKRSLRDRLRAALADPRAQRARAVGHELAPLWWTAHALLVWWLLGRPGPLMLVLVTVASLWLGLEMRRRRIVPPRLALVVTVILALLAVPVLGVGLRNTWTLGGQEVYVQAAPLPGDELVYQGAPLRGVYAYDRNGRRLLDVLLYGDNGQPLTLGTADEADRRILRDRSGDPVLNAFPIRYFEPGTRRVADPKAGPEVEVPAIETPPLKVRRRGGSG